MASHSKSNNGNLGNLVIPYNVLCSYFVCNLFGYLFSFSSVVLFNCKGNICETINRNVLNYHVNWNVSFGKSIKYLCGNSRLIWDSFYRNSCLIFVVGYSSYDYSFHCFIFLLDKRSLVFCESTSYSKRNFVLHCKLDRPYLENLCTK